MVTRELMEQLAKDFDKERFVKKARDYADSIKESNPKRAEKFYRRADKLATPDPIQAFFGPRTLEPNASENDILREVKRLDSLKEFPKIWDRQYCASYMIESGGEDALRRYMKTMYVDAVKENIVWIEAAAPALRLDEDGKEVDDSRYKMILKVWRELEKEYKGKVSLRFILPHPKSPAEAKTVLAWIKALGDDDAISIVGFGAWGSEDSAAESKEVFEMLRDAGYPIICHHAGEYLSKGDEEKRSTGNMWASLRFAKAERIGHGICAVTDEKLIAELKEKGVCLEVCPLSNRMLTYIPNGLRSHPLRKLFDAGIPCTLGSDDPGFFGTSVNAHSLNREYLIVRHFLGFTDKQLATLARNSITYSKAPAKLKERALAQIDVWLDGGC